MTKNLYKNPWTYQGKPFTDDDVGDLYGFVYTITNTANGRKYIGMKLFTSAGYKQVNKKKVKVRKPSTWKTYYGSSKSLLADIALQDKSEFKREIIHLCKTNSETKYKEAKMIMETDAILREDYYNGWFTFRGNEKHLKHLCDEYRLASYKEQTGQ